MILPSARALPRYIGPSYSEDIKSEICSNALSLRNPPNLISDSVTSPSSPAAICLSNRAAPDVSSNRINLTTSSGLVEEKSYKEY